MELKLVKHADVYPSEGNPREDFGDLEGLAATLAVNPAYPGEPLNPPVLVRDGGVYRIVDGERRWRAMELAGTKEFHAVVCDDWDDADAALAMLATDDKKELTEVERSKGAQRALLLGVEPEMVEKAARKRGMRSVKRAAGRLGAEAECMSLDHLLAVDELAEWPELAEQVAAADEKSWERAYDAAKAQLERDKAEKALRDAAARLRLDLVEQGEADTAGMAYALTCRTPADLEAAAEEYAGGAMYVARSTSYDGARVAVYTALPDDEEADPEQQAALERAESWLVRMTDAHASATQFLAERLAGGGFLPGNAMAMAAEDYLGDAGQQWSERSRASEFLGRFELDAPKEDGAARGMLGAALLRRLADGCAPGMGDMMAAAGAAGEPMIEYSANRILRCCDYCAAAMEDGWQAPDEDVQLMCKLTGLADAALAEDEKED